MTVARLHGSGSIDGFWALVDAWCDHMVAREMTTATIEQREAYLLRFLRRTRLSPENVTAEDCDRFLSSVTPRSSKRESYVASMRGFFRFCNSRGLLPRDPTTDLHARSPKYPKPDYFSGDEIAAILAAADTRHPAKRRPALVLLFETGARIGSLAGVRPQDVSDARMFFRIAKNDRAYSVPLTPAARDAAQLLLELHHGGETLIERHEDTIGDWFRDAARDAGLPEGRVRAHLARHTAATLLYERTGDPLLVAEYLNHSDLDQVQRYARVTDKRIEQALEESLTG